MHLGDDAALETHYVPRRSQRTRSVLPSSPRTAAHTTSSMPTPTSPRPPRQARRSCLPTLALHLGHCPEPSGVRPKGHHRAGLGELDRGSITFLTLRCARRHSPPHRRPAPPAWNTVALDRDGAYRPQGHRRGGQHLRLPRYRAPARGTGLGRDAPTMIITNDRVANTKQLIDRYAHRMTIEQRLGGHPFFPPRPLSSVAPNVDLDAMLSAPPRAVCAATAPPSHRLPQRHPRYPATPFPFHRGPTSSTKARSSSYGSNGAPTPQCYAKPISPPRSQSPAEGAHRFEFE